jgi:hypothetical protein
MGQHFEVFWQCVGRNHVSLPPLLAALARAKWRECVPPSCEATDPRDYRAHRSNQQVPTLDTNWGTGMLIVNIFLPGVGTLVAGIKSERNTTMVIGVFQFLLAFIIVGWIWSIYWGYLLYKKVRAPC